MARKATILLAVVFLVGGTAFAEDGFKLFFGYSLGKLNNTVTWYWTYSGEGSGDYAETFSAIAHGPSVEARYEKGSLFARGTFDFYLFQSAEWTWGDGEYDGPGEGNLWAIEADFGYKVLSRDSTMLAPYAGLGLFRLTGGLKDDPWETKLSAPFLSLGAIASRSTPEWSAGFDGALLILLFAKTTESGDDWSDTYSHNFGYGFRFQVPVTYTISKKENSVIMIFAKPYFLYMNSGKSKALTWEGEGWSETWAVKQSPRLLGIKVGAGLSF